MTKSLIFSLIISSTTSSISSTLISFSMMLGLAAVAEPVVMLLIGEKWYPCILYLQLLCIAGVFHPVHSLNLTILKVKGRSDLFLKLEVIKKILAIPSIIIGIYFGIEFLILGMLFNSIIALFINSFWSKKLINYGIFQQMKDLAIPLLVAIFSSLIVFLLGFILNWQYSFEIAAQILIGVILFIVINEFLKISSYSSLKKMVFKRLKL